MQIIPTNTPPLGEQLLASVGHDSSDAASFIEELLRQQAARQAVAASDAHSVQSVLGSAAERTPLAHAPYSRNTTDGVTYTTEEACFTKQELAELHQKLELAGAPPETLHGLESLMQQPDGATLAQVVASLHPVQEPVELDEATQNALKSLAGKIDATGALGDRIVALAQEGKGQEVWKQISAALNQLPPGSTIRAERDEVAFLARAMGLSPNAQQQLMGNFGPNASLQVTPGGFDLLMTPAQADLMQRAQNQQKLDKALDSTLQPLLRKARKRMEAEKAASEHSSRRTEQSKVLIEKTVMHKVNATLDGTQKAQSPLQNMQEAPTGATEKGKPLGDAPRLAGQDGMPQPAPQEGGKQPPSTQNAVQHSLWQQEQQQQREARGGFGSGDNGTRNKNSDKREGWEPLLSKVEVRTSAAASTASPSSFAAAAAAGINTAMGSQIEGAAARQSQPLAPRQALSQVEQAMLTAMRDGSKRLEIQLDPVDLGTLTLTLTSRNGEVSAIIRSERGETADMITRQLDVLRTNLEQQGVKVDKLEVQNQAADNRNNPQWDSTQQHNARQEEYARRDTLDRLRVLGRHCNNETNHDIALLEQGVQSGMHAAGNAAQGIYIVA